MVYSNTTDELVSYHKLIYVLYLLIIYVTVLNYDNLLLLNNRKTRVILREINYN